METTSSTDRPFIFVSDGMNEQIFSQLKSFSQWEVSPKSKNSLETLQEQAPRIHALVVRSATKVNRELIDCMKNVRIIIRAGEGMDNIDLDYCQQKGIAAFNTPGANGNAAAEMAITHMLSLLRHAPQAQQSMQAGKWEKSLFVGHELTGMKVGIFGFGKIGQTVAKRLQGFETEIFYFDPVVERSELGQKCHTLEELFQKSSLISIHAPLTQQTKNIVNLALLKQLSSPGWLVNCARGGIIDEAELLQALEQNLLQGAALDVFAQEPLEEDSPLRQHPKILLSPHLGASTVEAELRVGKQVINLLMDFFSKIP